MRPVMIGFNVEDMGDIFEGVDVVVRPIDLEFIQVCLAARRKMEMIERLLETPSYLSGSPSHQDGIINKERMIDGLNPCFEGEARNHSFLKLFVKSSAHTICN